MLPLLITLIFSTTSFLSSSQQILEHFTTNSGLPSPEVYDVHQDFDGYMWFCTDRGISRYNGYEFENFTTQDGLTYNTVFKVFEDKHHNLWFTCYNGTLTIYNYQNKQFTHFQNNDFLKENLGPNNWVQAINFKGNDIYLFPNRYSNKVYQVQQETGEITSITWEDSLFIGDKINDRQLLTGIVPRSNNYQKYITLKSKSNDTIPDKLLSMISDLSSISKRTVDLEKEGNFINAMSYFGGTSVTNRWKKVVIESETGTISHLNFESSNSEMDREGNLWISTVTNGVFLVKNSTISIFSLDASLEPIEKISALAVHDEFPVVGTSIGKIIQGTNNKILKQTSLKLRRINFFPIEENHLLVPYYSALKIGSNSNGELEIIPRISTNNYNAVFSELFSMCDSVSLLTRSDAYYIGINDNIVFERREKPYHALKNPNAEIYLSTNADLVKITEQNYRNPESIAKKLNLENIQVRKMAWTRNSTLILATSGKGIIFAKNDQEVFHLDKQSGLNSDVINAIYFDEERNRLWCGTNKGVCIVDFKSFDQKIEVKSIHAINEMDGLPDNYVADMSASSDLVWIALVKNIVSIPKNYEVKAKNPPKTNIISLFQNNQNFLNKDRAFSYDENDIRIEYLAVSFAKPSDTKFYRYQLNRNGSSNSKWIYTDERSLSLMNLSDGDYTFLVSARSENSAWGIPQAIHFSIKPFFLNILWVRLLILGFAIGIAYYLYKRRIRKIQRENLEKMKLANLQLANQQLELAALRGQMNPHFTFNILSSIQKKVLSNEKWKANKLITRFSKLIRSSLEFSRSDYISLNKEIDFLQNYLEIEQNRIPDKFDYEIKTTEGLNLASTMIPALLIQPLCENALKHAFPNGKGKLLIQFHQIDEESLDIIVEDNGIGMYHSNSERNEMKHSMGLQIVKDRILLFQQKGLTGEIDITSSKTEKNKGTKITLTVPCQ